MKAKGTSANRSLLFHHHEQVFVDEHGGIWMSSGIGLWVQELISHFGKVYLMLFAVSERSNKHDLLLTGENFELVNLGSKGNYFDFISKRQRVKKISKNYSGNVDYLLVRGFTPMQNLVWKYIQPKRRKIFYLVRSLRQDLPYSFFSLSFIAHLSNRRRERRFKEILDSDCLMVANSEFIAAELRKHNRNTVRFAPTNVISNDVVPPFSPAVRGTEFQLLFVGRISEMKGFSELVEALGELSELKPNFRATIVGEGHPKFLEEVENRIAELAIGDRIDFKGRMSFGEALFELYKQSHAFVLPSRSEGFARVIWEAALFSCPIVVTKVGGIPFVMNHDESALLIEPKDHLGLKKAILVMMENEEKAKRLAENAYNLALENTLESGVRRFIEHLEAEE